MYIRGKIISSFDSTRATALTNGDFPHLTKITITRPHKLILATRIIKLSSVANMSLNVAQRHHEYADYTLF